MNATTASPERSASTRTSIRLSTEMAVSIYNDGIAPRLIELVRKQRAWKRNSELTWIAALALAVVVGSLSLIAMDVTNAVLLALLVGAGAQWALSKRPQRDIGLAMRQEIFKPLCDAAGISYSLAPMQSNAESFAGFGLIDSFSASRFENQLAGAYKGIVFLQTDAQLSKHGSDAGSIVFNGLLSVFELKKNYVGQTLVLKNDRCLQNVADRFQHPPERVDLKDWTFEQSFEVYATDDAEARSIMTPVLRGQLLALEELLGFDIQLAFTGSSMLMSVDLTENAIDITDPGFTATDERRLQAALIRFQAIFETLDVLQLAGKSKAPSPI
ncbi:DUF3137 domain-containing protein [Pelagibius sp. Alg239-R121]|uniref:DUF3137 domain-containing protein n=1 Tax=Pelagibius sp. Alg239-R121 TaxID=2993448 RepID=UPI0024A661E8|nr:DUF3137 domain-containing protein [Pelagibius sp. Alg239-R121]